MDKTEEFRKFEEAVMNCQNCNLWHTRTNVVPGDGNINAEIMLIGEGPGKNEDLQGKPFVGAAGQLLTALLTSINLKRENVYIANVVKCRPPNNRDPLPEEALTCWPWLETQIHIIQPKIIITLGRHSLARFSEKNPQISQVHGRALRKEFPGVGKIVFFPSYHPAAALYNGGLRETLFKDFAKLPKILEIINKESSIDQK
jgi:DNA polymerase